MAEPVKVSLVGDASGLISALDAALAKTQTTSKGMEGALGGVQKIATTLGNSLMGLGASLLAGFSFKKVIDDTVEWGTESGRLQRALGGTKEEASVLAMAIDDIHGSVEDFLAGAGKMTKTLNGNEAAIQRLGVQTRDVNGRFKDTPTLISEINAKLGEFTEGTDRNIEAQKVYGKSYAEMLRFIALTPAVMDAARDKARSLNLELSPEKAATIKAYRDAQNDVGDVIKGLAVTIGLKLMPALTEMGDWFAKKGPDLIDKVGRSFDFLQGVLSNTVVRIGIFAYAMNLSLVPVLANVRVQLLAFAAVLMERVSAGLFLGMTRTQAWAGALLQSINPIHVAVIVLAALGLGLERYITASERAAKAAERMAGKTADANSRFLSLAKQAGDLDAILKSGSGTMEQRKNAQERLSIVIAQLNSLYPGFNKFLVDEAGHQRSITEALRLQNEERQKGLTLELKQAEASLAKAKAAVGTGLAEMSTDENAPGLVKMMPTALIGNKALASQKEAVEKYQEAVDKLRDSMKDLKGESAAIGGLGSSGGTDSESNLAKLKADLERWKANEEARADASGQFREVSKKEEADWLDQRKTGYQLNAKELYQVELEVSKLRRGVRLDEFEAEQARLQTALEASKNAGAERIRIAEEIAAREAAAGDARAKQAEAAKQAVIKIRREVAQEEKQLQAQQLEGARAHQLALLQLDEDEIRQRMALGRLDTVDGLRQLQVIEQARYESSRRAIEAQQANDALTTEQRQKLNNDLQALDDAYGRKRIEAKAAVDAELRKTDGLGGWVDGLRSALEQGRNYFQQFKDMATSVVSGVTNAFSTGIEGILTGQMTLGQALKSVWQGILSTIIKALAQLAAQWIVTTAIEAALGKKRQGAAASVAITAQHTAAAETWAAYAGIPFVGQALALAQIAVMNASLLANLAGATGMGGTATALAVGGRIDTPTLALMGEAGPEIVAPERNFLDWSKGLTTMGADLGANIARRQAATEGYGLAGAGYAAAAAAQGGRNIAQGGSFTGGGHLFDFRGAMFLGESAESSRQFQNAVKNAMDGYDWAKG